MGFIALIDYGMGNLRNVERALTYVGAEVRVVRTPSECVDAAGILLPGVGNFHDAMKNLEKAAFCGFLREWAAQDRPFLGICLGLQMLFEASEEAPGVSGLGILPGICKKFVPGQGVEQNGVQERMTVPHIGWNTVRFSSPNPCFSSFFQKPAWFYFVHSFYAAPADPTCVAGQTNYINHFTSAVSRGNLAATQFHPEKSQENGLAILRGFAALCKGVSVL